MDRASLDSILEHARRHDPDALTALVDRFHRRVFGLLYRLTGSSETAEDLMQETFLRVVRTIADYQHQGRFEAWLFRIAANLARDHARRQGRRGAMASLDAGDDETFDVASEASDEPFEPLMTAESGQRLEAALAELPPAEREVVLLRHYSDLSFREIAEMLGVPLGTALARSHRAMKRLRAALENTGVVDV